MTVMLNATAAALRTHQEVKLDALRNAVVNSGLHLEPDEHVQLMFIRFVDELTGLHLRLLAFLNDPPGWFSRERLPQPSFGGSRTALLEAAFPELQGQREVYSQAVRELAARGLAHDALSGMVTDQRMSEALSTPLGDRFLGFIANSDYSHHE